MSAYGRRSSGTNPTRRVARAVLRSRPEATISPLAVSLRTRPPNSSKPPPEIRSVLGGRRSHTESETAANRHFPQPKLTGQSVPILGLN